MFCFKCGHQIVNDALFCSKCGASQNRNSSKTENVVGKNTSPTGLDREAIKIYLSDILALECIKSKLSDDYADADNKLAYETNNNYVEHFPIPNGTVWLAYQLGAYYIGCFRGEYGEGAYTGEYLNREGMLNGEGFIKYVWGQGIRQHNGEFYWGRIDSNSLPIIKKSSFWWDIGGDNIIDQMIRRTSARNAFLKTYEGFEKTAPGIYENILKTTVLPLQRKVAGIEEEYQRADELLQKAYAVNIIPKNFRNIHAVWFIHDYITTSNETLEAALLQCNLDEIKQKLDIIIDQNNRIIIQNAIQVAQNSQMLQQNQQILNRLADIEDNTIRAAQYAEIASNNAEACAWIGMANYIKK